MEHLSEQDIAGYRARTLDASSVLRVSDHLLECEPCRARLTHDSELASAAAGLEVRLTSESVAFAHLDYDEIAAYVDGTATGPDRDRVNRHIGACTSCSANVNELRILKAELDPARATRRPGLWMRLWPAIALAAACIIITGIALRPRENKPVAKAELPRQQQPTPAPAIVLADGSRQIVISPDGAVAGIEGLPAGIHDAVVQALAARHIDLPAQALAAKRDVLLGAPAVAQNAELAAPLGVIVESQTPVFRWKPLADAEYQVSVYTADFQPAAVSGWIHEAEWRSTTPLARGVRYSWQLTVRRGGSEFTSPAPPAPEARFQILNAAAEDDLARLRSEWKDAHLVTGIAYAKAGLVEEARRELTAAAAQNPGSSVIAALLDSLNSSQRPPK